MTDRTSGINLGAPESFRHDGTSKEGLEGRTELARNSAHIADNPTFCELQPYISYHRQTAGKDPVSCMFDLRLARSRGHERQR